MARNYSRQVTACSNSVRHAIRRKRHATYAILFLPGDAPRPPAEFLRDHLKTEAGLPSPASWALRKFLRLADPPEAALGVWLPRADHPVMRIR